MMSTILSQTSDAVRAVLDTIKVTGAVLSVAHLEEPFAVTSGRPSTGVFHAVLSGEAWAWSTQADEPALLGPGQVAVFPGGTEHLIASAPRPPVTPVPVSASGPGPLPTMRVANGGPVTRLLCGTITFETSPAITVTDALPDVIVTGADPARDWVRSTVEMIAEELAEGRPASTVVAARLTDVLVVRALREMVLTGHGSGWAAALGDPRLADALAAIHARPGDDWTVTGLARVASMSRSSFYERFTATVGVPPGEYLARWRIHVACGLLSTTSTPIGSIARASGFATDAGFSTSFKRLVGMPPSHYRAATGRGEALQ